jgi:hypothetical protein
MRDPYEEGNYVFAADHGGGGREEMGACCAGCANGTKTCGSSSLGLTMAPSMTNLPMLQATPSTSSSTTIAGIPLLAIAAIGAVGLGVLWFVKRKKRR